MAKKQGSFLKEIKQPKVKAAPVKPFDYAKAVVKQDKIQSHSLNLKTRESKPKSNIQQEYAELKKAK